VYIVLPLPCNSSFIKMRSLLLLFLSTLTAAHLNAGHGADEASEMGPVQFLWPPDRPWHPDDDNVSPCGTKSGPGERTDFPLMNGHVALVMRDLAWETAIRISYKENPTKQSDFESIISNATRLEDGHMCYPMPPLPRDIEPGQKATLQIEYFSNDEGQSPNTDTFFACSDIQFVRNSKIGMIPNCFNVTATDFVSQDEIKAQENNPLQGSNKKSDGSRTALAAFWVGIVSGFVTFCIV